MHRCRDLMARPRCRAHRPGGHGSVLLTLAGSRAAEDDIDEAGTFDEDTTRDSEKAWEILDERLGDLLPAEHLVLAGR
jgi:hypothetical protein